MRKLAVLFALLLSLVTTVATATAGEAYVVLVDKSGSMQDGKMEHTKAALVAAFEQLDDDDRIGIIAFDDSPSILLADGSPASAIEAIATLRDGGGTDVQPAMELGYELIEAIDQTHDDLEALHMIVMTDGQTSWGTIHELTEKIHADGITVSSVALGHDADTVLLNMIAETGAGVATRANAGETFGVAIFEALGLDPSLAPVAPATGFPPPPAPPTSSYVFVVDTSESQGRLGLVLTQDAIRNVRRLLSQDSDRVAIIAAGETPLDLLADGAPSDAAAAIDELALDANEGDLSHALDAAHSTSLALAAAHPQLSHHRVIVLTDGGPADADAILELADTLLNDGISVSTLAIGDDADTELLMELARVTRGDAVHIDAMAELDGALQTLVRGPGAAQSSP